MTISSDNNKSGPYLANGVTTVFPRGFYIESADHLEVYQTDAEGVLTKILAGWTVDGVGGASGNVTFDTAPVDGLTLTLIRSVPILQETDYSAQGKVSPTQVESDLDEIVTIIQDQSEFQGRTLTMPVDSTESGVLPSDRGGKLLGFNDAGAPVTYPVSTRTSDIAEYDTIADLKSETNAYLGELGDIVKAGPHRFQITDQADHSISTAGSVLLYALPDADGFCCASQFGVVPADRSAAATNGTAINLALAYCGTNGFNLSFCSGAFFCSEPIVQALPVNVRASGWLDEWSKLMNAFQGRAGTTLVMTGTGSKDATVFGVSSARNWGAGRDNPSARTLTHNDASYELLSFIEENATTTGRAKKAFSVAWHVKAEASGSAFTGFRLLPDYGGDDGMDGYSDLYANTVGVLDYPLSAGDWDVGLYVENTRNVLIDRLQVVGQWRMAGLLCISHSKTSPAGLYKNTFVDCHFSGYHGVEIRSYDGAPVDANTTTTVDIPWADDHPFGADGDNEILLADAGWPDSTVYTFTGMVKDTSGAYDTLRLTGITPNVPSDTKLAFPNAQGGGTSHTSFLRGEITGFQHPSREPCHIKGLAGVTDGVFSNPGGCLFVSGTKVTETDFNRTSLTGYEEVMAHVHDCRNFSFDGYIEANKTQSSRGGRVIFSPETQENAYSLSGFASGSTLRPTWVHRGSTVNDGTLDTRPALPYIDATDFTDGADMGFMEGAYLHAPLDPGMNGNMTEGSAAIAAPGGRAGIGYRTGKPPFSNPDVGNIEWALHVDPDAGNVVASKDVIAESAAGAALGEFGAGAFGRSIAHRFASFEVTIADDAAATFSNLTSTGGFVYVVQGPASSYPQFALSGQAFFDIGTSPYATQLSGGTNFAVLAAAVSGTTGVDGEVTLGVADGVLSLENRSGSSEKFSLTIVG